jgi:RHS repeat-associated protein
MESRSWSAPNFSYRHGFNGMEQDNEVKGDGNSLDFGARIYDSRLGRWMSTDPNWRKYPSQSPYNFAINSPLMYKDIDGNDIWLTICKTEKNEKGEYVVTIKPVLRIITEIDKVVNMTSNLPQAAIDALFAANPETYIVDATEPINSLISGDVFETTTNLIKSTFGMNEVDALGLNVAVQIAVIGGLKVDVDIIGMKNDNGELEVGLFWGWGVGFGLAAGAGAEVVAYDINEDNSSFQNMGLRTFTGPQYTTGIGGGAISGTRIFSDGFFEPDTKIFGFGFDEELYTAYGLGGVTPLPPLEEVRAGVSRMSERSYFIGSINLSDYFKTDTSTEE